MGDPNKQKAVIIRNAFTKVLCFVVCSILIFIIISVLNVLIERGLKYTSALITGQSPIDLLSYFFIMFKKNWSYIIKNYMFFNNYKAFFIRNILTTLIPTGIFLGVVYHYKQQIIDWQPFRQQPNEFGDAHFASIAEMKKANLFEKKGCLLGKYKDKFLVEMSFQHILLFAPTGSGKGVGFVIPNLLFWDNSVIVHDIKLENYEKTSGYRFKVLKQKVFLWNPADQQGITHCYNPLDWVARDMGGLVDDIQKIAKFLLPKEDFWNSEARSLVTGLMLYLYADDARSKSLGETLRLVRSEDLAYTLAVVLDTMGEKLHPVAYMNLGAFLNKPDKERGGVTSTASSCLELWSNPFVDTATSKSHVNISSFRTIATSFFVGISPNNIERLRPLLQIFYQQCATMFTSKMPVKSEKIGVMMLLDEFPTLGELLEIKVGIAYYRGYKVKLFLIVQDTEQLKDIYKDAGMNSFLSNSYYRITYSANNIQTAQMISNMLGKATIETEDAKKTKYINLSPGEGNVTISKKARDLLMPQEVINLPRDEEIILIESNPPVKCKKIFYYKEKMFIQRVDMPKTFVPKQAPIIMETKPKKKE